MHPPGADTVVVRHGDVNQKSGRVQGEMEAQLVANLEALLADRGIDATVERRWTRPLIHATEDTVEAATDAATDAFGVVSASPATVTAPELPAVESALATAAREHYDGGTFAVSARRAGDELPFTSEDVQERGGAAVWDAAEAAGVEPAVDLEDPDLTFFVECRPEDAFVFLEKRSGTGGLPLYTQAPLVALISGGIDSPVAAHEAMSRGSPVVPVYFDLGEYGGPDHEARAMETVRHLSRYAPGADWRVFRVPAGEAVALLAAELDGGRMLAFRRFMFRAAGRLAAETDAAGIVTGEAIGQKSSQTARNLAVTSRATDLPVHRPLLTADKHEIAERAREIGTFEGSTIPAGCNRFAPDRPETAASLQRLREREPEDLLERADRAAANADRVDPTGW